MAGRWNLPSDLPGRGDTTGDAEQAVLVRVDVLAGEERQQLRRLRGFIRPSANRFIRPSAGHALSGSEALPGSPWQRWVLFNSAPHGAEDVWWASKLDHSRRSLTRRDRRLRRLKSGYVENHGGAARWS